MNTYSNQDVLCLSGALSLQLPKVTNMLLQLMSQLRREHRTHIQHIITQNYELNMKQHKYMVFMVVFAVSSGNKPFHLSSQCTKKSRSIRHV